MPANHVLRIRVEKETQLALNKIYNEFFAEEFKKESFYRKILLVGLHEYEAQLDKEAKRLEKLNQENKKE